jgi:predicted nucleotidyltransferase
MQTSLSHLPAFKRREVKKIAALIEQHAEVEMVILFGSYARGDWVEEPGEIAQRFNYQSDYDILVLVTNKRLANKLSVWGPLEDLIRNVSKTPVTLIVHSVGFFNKKLKSFEYFFVDIFKEGVCLFDSKRFKLIDPKPLTPEQLQAKAKEDYKYWFASAEAFYRACQSMMKEGELVNAAFQLHQATEHCYAAILLVFTNYKPKTHDLRPLNRQVCTQDEQFMSVFPTTMTGEENACLNCYAALM